MQTNNFKILSFPYYGNNSNDFINPKFNCLVQNDYKNGFIGLQVSYEIQNKDILNKISEGYLKVVARIESGRVGFKKQCFFKSDETSIKVSINSMEVDELIDIQCFLVAEKDFSFGFYGLNQKWENIHSIIQKNNIVGESNYYSIDISHSKAGTKKSIFDFVDGVDIDENEPYRVMLDSDRIVFSLSKKMHYYFNILQGIDHNLIISVFLIPEIALILSQMIEEKGEDGSEEFLNDFNNKNYEKRWYKVICDKYYNIFNKEPQFARDINPLYAAQKLFPESLNNLMRDNYLNKGREKND